MQNSYIQFDMSLLVMLTFGYYFTSAQLKLNVSGQNERFVRHKKSQPI